MKNLYTMFLLILFVFVVQSCNQKTQKNCDYSYEHSKTMLKWTAYKFTTKVGVSGTFNNINFNEHKMAKTSGGVFDQASFIITTNSVNSNNKVRDKKIADSFFGTMKNTANIKGKIISIDDALQGQAIINIEFNGVKKDVPFTFTTTPIGEFNASADFNIKDWDAIHAVDALNKVCSAEHTLDGISKLWPDVKIQIKSRLNKVCINNK